MSDGAAHEAHGLAVGTLVAVLGSLAGEPRASLLVAAGLVFGALWLSPDLDLDYSRPYRRWGPLRVLWWPYAQACAHRGLSHHWFAGPLFRLLYLAALLAPGLILGGAPEPSPYLWFLVAGVVAGNWLHLLADGVLFK